MIPGIIAADYAPLDDVLHAELLHFARERVAAPAEKLRGILLQALGLAQRHADEDALDLGHCLIEEAPRTGIELALGPVREFRHPVVVRRAPHGGAAEIGGDVLGTNL